MRLIASIARRVEVRGQEGFTMVLAIAAMFLVTAMSVATYAAVNNDQPMVRTDNNEKQAYAAAEAGIQQYLFDLDANNQYWAQCVPTTPNGINLSGSTANKRTVPGTSNQYAIELMPANGNSACSTSDPVGTMITTNGTGAGALRIRATGYAGNVTRTIVASLRESTFLDYVWFTKYETDDPQVQLIADGCNPTTCSNSSWSTALQSVDKQCTQYYRAGRRSASFYTDSSNNKYYCDQLAFITGDNLQGPVYTDDEFAVCGSPIFGRSSADPIMIGAPSPGESNEGINGCTNSATNNGPVSNNVGELNPPASDSALATQAAASGWVFNGPTCITFNSTGTVSVAHPTSAYNCLNTSNLSWTTYPSYPTNGVIYVQDSTTAPCTLAYNYTSPVYTAGPTSAGDNSGCGIAYVQGTYTSPVTVGTSNDIVVTGNLAHSGANSLLGLVANGFVRVYHTCSAGVNNLSIDAAILSVSHSFLVDDYNCGSTTYGTLTVTGSIAQLFRGGVGTNVNGVPSTGYTKNYAYDNRLMYEEPPDFLDPVTAAWHVVRENECSQTAAAGTAPANTC